MWAAAWTLASASAVAQSASHRRAFVVVIDPGHGGSNVGAPGTVEGLYEKRVTLALAQALAHQLADEPDMVVQLTRYRDEYVSLRDRAKFANAVNADVFISLHCNASPDHSQRGFETYVLAPAKLDIDTWAMRRGDGRPRDGVAPELGDILDDVERGVAAESSLRLAERVQKQLAQVRGAKQDRGVREGGQDVLMGPTMPAVLVEVGFLDHPVEGTELLTHKTRTQIVEALARAILEHRAAELLSVEYR